MGTLSDSNVVVRRAGRPVHATGRLGEGWPVTLSYQLPDESGVLAPADLTDYSITATAELRWAVWRDGKAEAFLGAAADANGVALPLLTNVEAEKFPDQSGVGRGQFHVFVDKDAVPDSMIGIEPDAVVLPTIIYSVSLSPDAKDVDVVSLVVGFRYGPKSAGVAPSTVRTVG